MSSKTICIACGTQYPPNKQLPPLCTICNDDRQYIPDTGQNWISQVELSNNHEVRITQINEQLFEMILTPKFAIGQRAFLILTPEGGILWDCIPLLNKKVIEFIRSKGGLKAIVFSHPHYYSNMNDWAAEFSCPVYIHSNDEQWIIQKSNSIKFWDGYEKDFWQGIKAINIGGHFSGSSVLYVPSFSPKGALFVGDTLYIAPSKRHIAMMYSYPNAILLPKEEFIAVHNKTRELVFDTMYGAFEGQTLVGNANEVFNDSMNRYLKAYGV